MHEELVNRLSEIESFLGGSGPIEHTPGNPYWFGNAPLGTAPFWWRKHMHAVFADVKAALIAPQAETCERDAVLEKLAQHFEARRRETIPIMVVEELRAMKTHSWPRKDGSTTPRGGEERRRHPHSMGFFASNRRLEHRRSADRSRWVQETPQTLEDWFYARWGGNNYSVFCTGAFLRDLCAELDRRSAGK